MSAPPCGLFQVFELGLLGIRAQVVDSLSRIGGQWPFLYPEKPIYDIPALPVVGAQELVDRLADQIRPFGAGFHLGEEVVRLARVDDGAFELETVRGTLFHTRAVVIAGGLGSFQPRPLRVPGVERYHGVNVEYKVVDKSRYRGKRLTVLGGGDSALDWAIELASSVESLTLVHRRDRFRAQPASVDCLRALAEDHPDRVRIVTGRVAGIIESGAVLVGIEVQPPNETADKLAVDFDELLVFYGLSPNLGPIAGWGLGVGAPSDPVDAERFETSVPGIFAVGDINTYPGKKKLILSGFHEAALAAFAVQKRIDPDVKQYLQYTTTSPIMHERLGVSGDLERAAE